MTTQKREDYWQEIVAECQNSGLSGRAFCKQQELPYHQFTYWRSKLRQAGSDEPEERCGFARVSVADLSRSNAELTITLPSGIAITGLRGDTIDMLGPILRQL